MLNNAELFAAPKLRHSIKSHLPEIIFLVTYYLALFPGRISNDAEVSIQLMNAGKSTSNWTELYFRFLQLITFNGLTIALASAIGLLVLTTSFKFFINSAFNNLKIRKNIFRFFCIFPLMPVFGITVQHDVFACAGTLLITGILLRTSAGEYIGSPNNYLRLFLSIFFASMSYIGIVAVVGLLFSFIFSKNRIFIVTTITSLIVIQALSLTFAVTPKDAGFKLIPFLGDLKCIAQDDDSVLTVEQWKFLEKLGSRDDWTTSQTCISADNAMFAVKSAGDVNILEFVNNWSGIVSQNSRVFLSARIQRASMALPPLFFSGQPNARETDFLVPVGVNSNRSLRIAPEVIIDAPLDGKFKNQQIPLVKYLELPLLSAAFLINQNSKVWGWGGFWIIWFVAMLIIFEKRVLGVILPVLFQFFILIFLSPLPDPRYVFSWILMGLASALYLTLVAIRKIKFDMSEKEY